MKKAKETIIKILNNDIYRKNFYIFVILPIILNLVIEIFSRNSVIDGFAFLFTHPVQFFCNTMFIAFSLSIGLVVKKRTFYISFVSGIWVLAGIVNWILLEVRVTPFNASDLMLVDAAATIIDQYFTPFLIVLAAIGICLVILALILLFIKGKKVQYKINYWRNLVIVAAVFVVTLSSLNIAIDTGFLATKFTNLTNAYNEYGFVYCFGAGIFNTGVKKPSDYSQDKIDSIIDEISGKEDNIEKKPNIIFLQLESFFDVTKANDIEFNQDPIPYFRELSNEYSSGYLNVFNVGYGTCNTEFEIITSMNLDDFGPGELPYKSVLKDNTCESMAYNLKEYGYATHAMHDNDATFYSRSTVFPNLGFDTFTSIEYMNVEEYTYEGWAKDKVLTGEIMNILEKTEEPDYIYCISVQGHGSYPSTPVLEDTPIKIVSGLEGDEERKNQIEYYANQIHEMDDFIRELVDSLEKCGEDSILVMYGDHLPGLGFKESELENESLYQTQYVIWNNFGMEKRDAELQTWQLSPRVLSSLGMKAGVINKYHQQYILAEDGRDGEEEDIEEEYLGGLQNLEYDILYGEQLAYGGVSPYLPTDMKMGIDDVIISEVTPFEENSNDYVGISGENFTKHSVVYINGKKYDTEYVDENTLKVKYSKLKSLDSFVVSQVDKDSGYVISSSKESLYYGQ